jgi:hypothetical protein
LAQQAGTLLFSALFAGPVEISYRTSLAAAGAQQAGLRIRLRLNEALELTGLPWEYLYDPLLGRFLTLSTQTPLVRYLELPQVPRPLTLRPPLRVLVLTADMPGLPSLNVEREWTTLKTALAGLERDGLVSVDRLDKPSLAELDDRLRRGTYHVFHYAGHGAGDPTTGAGLLVLADGNGQPCWTRSDALGALLSDHQALRIIILNACDTARPFAPDLFASLGSALARQGIPAVIAMQTHMSDQASAAFAHGLYASIAEDYPIDAAVSGARKAILAAGRGIEWGIPVLFLQAADGAIFSWDRSTGREDRMDSADLAATVVGRLVSSSGPGAADAAGLHGLVENRLRTDPYANQTLARLKEQPESAPRQAALIGVLAETIQADPAFAARLEDLLTAGRPAETPGISQHVSISGQARTGDVIQIGKVDGNIDVRNLFKPRK